MNTMETTNNILIFDCRMTGAGASTSVVREYHATKKSWSAGTTHWKEKIIFTAEDGAVLLQDISNRGNHSCAILTARGERFPVCSDEPCCADIACGTDEEFLALQGGVNKVETIIVTRHAALVELLVERGIVESGVRVLDHTTPQDVRGKHVIGVLPLSLAALAESVTEIPLKLTPELRGKELDLVTLRGIAGDAVRYRVEVLR